MCVTVLGSLPSQVSNLQYEMLLLTDSISKEGGCWELRLRCGTLVIYRFHLLCNVPQSDFAD